MGSGALLGMAGAGRLVGGGRVGRVRAGEVFIGAGGVGLFSLEGRYGFGEPEGEGKPLTGGFTGDMCPFLKGEFETIFRGERSAASGEVSGGTGGFCVRAGE